MKKRFMASVVLGIAAAFVISGCGSGHISAYKSAISDLVSAKEKFAGDIASATSAQALANATKSFAGSVDKFVQTRTDLFMKYPQLTDRGPYPENITRLLEQSVKLDEKIDNAIIPAMDKFPGDAGVISAWEDLTRKRSSL